jgi:hypothetical protein
MQSILSRFPAIPDLANELGITSARRNAPDGPLA